MYDWLKEIVKILEQTLEQEMKAAESMMMSIKLVRMGLGRKLGLKKRINTKEKDDKKGSRSATVGYQLGSEIHDINWGKSYKPLPNSGRENLAFSKWCGTSQQSMNSVQSA